MVSSSKITGYYRYTDIWWEWDKVLPPEDASKVKAILAHDAITHPDHPLHEDGVEGVALFMGTFQNGGENRLLFSSKQIEYIRYWLHAMGLTKELLPLPYSECLLTDPQDLQLVSRVTYKDGGALRGAIKQIDKQNKRLKGSPNPTLMERRLAFERARTYFTEKKGVFLAIDIEAWQYEHKMITELGWSIIRWNDGYQIKERGHFIIKEHENYTNGKYVPEHRWEYGFGVTEKISVRELEPRVRALLESNSASGPLFLVFHDFTNDLKYLKAPPINAPLDGATLALPDKIPESGIYIFDTSLLFGALEGNGKDRRSLKQVCNQLQIPILSPMHNAGNDAEYTILAFKSMASGDPVDIQRETRWPSSKGQSTIEVRGGECSDESDDDWY